MLIMGILNVTPDSFSDGGRYVDAGAALDHARTLIADGAAIIDVGGESTRPGATSLSADDEWSRIEPVVRGLVDSGVLVSVDTYHAQTARKAARAGAHIINDVTGGSDPDMFATVAELGCDYVLQHTRGELRAMDSHANYDDVVGEVIDELCASRDRAIEAGINPAQIILDPGLGFAKLGEDNWALLREIDQLVALGHRVLVGASRKRFTGDLAGPDHGDRDIATAMTSSFLSQRGVWAARVHNVRASALALATTAKLEETNGLR